MSTMSKQKKKQFDGIVYSTNQQFEYEETETFDVETVAPQKQQLRVSLDKRQRAGKAVTLISGFIGKSTDLEKLGKTLKQRCGVGGTVKDAEILIQGDFRVKIIDFLIKEGYKVKQVGG